MDQPVEAPKPCVAPGCPNPQPCLAHSFSITRDGVTKILYAPNSVQQWEFHEATEANVILEGSRGGGKSYCMRWDAYIRCMAIPGFKALVLRRTMPELRKSHLIYVDGETQTLTGEKCYNRSEYTVYFPNGSLLVFGHCEDDSAIERYLSSEWDGIYFDELVTFELRQFLLISASARTKTGSRRIAIVRGGTNPVGVGATWVKEWFIDKCPSREEAPDYIPADWRAITVNLDDNPDVDRESYDKRLRSLPSDALRRAYRYGEWVAEGQFFSEWRETREGKPWHVINEMPTQRGIPIQRLKWVEVVRSIDWGYSKEQPGCCIWYACLPDDTYIAFQEYIFSATIPKDVAKEIKRRSTGLKIRYTVGDPNMWSEEQGECIAETIRRHGVPMSPADNERENGWVRLHSMLIETHNDGVIEKPQFRILSKQADGSGCPTVIKAMPTAVVDPKKPADLKGPMEDPLDTCFIDHTLIATATGHCPLTELRVGDYVQTRAGLKAVEAVFKVGTRPTLQLTMSNGRTLVGTADHPIWVEGNGFTPLGELGYGDLLQRPPYDPNYDEPLSVLCVNPVGPNTVYNISVEGQHEYYAEGALVANCRYFAMSRPTRSREPVRSTLSPELLAIIRNQKRRPLLGSESVKRRAA